MRRLLLIFALFLSIYILHTTYYILPVHAFTIKQPSGYGIQVEGKSADSLLETIITNAITVVFAIAAVLVITFLIWGAIDWIMSGGDKEKVSNARKKITSALIGLAILAFVFVIAAVLGEIIGFNPLRPEGLPINPLGGK